MRIAGILAAALLKEARLHSGPNCSGSFGEDNTDESLAKTNFCVPV